MVCYFAYGSNMFTRRLQQRIGEISCIATARLPGHRLMFHKVGMDGSAKCDAWQTMDPHDVVLGVIFAIPHEQLTMLDHFEGEGCGYRRDVLEVEDERGDMQRVFTYRATDRDTSLKPFDWYRLHVLQGAREHGLAEDYIRAIAVIPVQVDTDLLRRQHEIRIHEGIQVWSSAESL